MAEFIFIAPEGWDTFTSEQLNNAGLDFNALAGMTEVSNYGDLAASLRDSGVINPDQGVTEARMFNGELLVARLHIL